MNYIRSRFPFGQHEAYRCRQRWRNSPCEPAANANTADSHVMIWRSFPRTSRNGLQWSATLAK